MPKSTNANAPETQYGDARPKQGAAFRDSITLEEAKGILSKPAPRRKLENVLGRRDRKGKPFHSDPWSAWNSPGVNGKEYDLDGGKFWRAVRFAECWFLARHFGAYNDFEFWHISDPRGMTRALPSIGAVGATVVMNAPARTARDYLDSINDKSGVTIHTPVSSTEGLETWDDPRNDPPPR